MAKLVALDGFKPNDAGIPEIHAEGCKDIVKPVLMWNGKHPRPLLMVGESLEEIAETWYAIDVADAVSEGRLKEEVVAGIARNLNVMNCAKKAIKASK